MQYFVTRGNLYYKNKGDWLSRCIDPEEAKRRLIEENEDNYQTTEIHLYRRIQREVYFWPSMRQEVARVQRECSKC